MTITLSERSHALIVASVLVTIVACVALATGLGTDTLIQSVIVTIVGLSGYVAVRNTTDKQ